MKHSRKDKKQRVDAPVRGVKEHVPARQMLTATPYPNEAMKIHRTGGGCVAAVPLKRPNWLVPPLSWVLPYSRERRVQLDKLGSEVLEACDGRSTVETLIEKFAANHKLSFREAQLAVTQFLRQLTQRGLIAIIGTQEDNQTT
jgi:hypothetical protein